jgi:hypothetical protein
MVNVCPALRAGGVVAMLVAVIPAAKTTGTPTIVGPAV